MRSQFRLGIDLDGVLYPFAKEITSHAEISFGHVPGSLQLPQTWRFYEDWGLTESAFHDLYRDAVHNGQLFAAGPATTGLLEALSTIASTGVELHVLTARYLPGVNRDIVDRRTRAWLEKLGVSFASVEILSGPKIAAAARLGLDAHLDDAPEHLTSLAETCTPIAWDQPWNRELPTAVRVSSGLELCRAVSALRATRCTTLAAEECHLHHSSAP